MFDYSEPPSGAARLVKGFLIQQFLVPVATFLPVGAFVGGDPLPVWQLLFLISLVAAWSAIMARLVVATWAWASETGRWIWVWPMLGVFKDVLIANSERPLSWYLVMRDGLTVALVTAPIVACVAYSLTQYLLTMAPVHLVSCSNKSAASSSGMSSITS